MCRLTRVKRGKERNVVVVESFVATKSNTYRRSIWLIHTGICCWTLISNGSYGHLNNHLAHPPSLNSLRVFSPPCPSIFLFSEPRRYQRRMFWRSEKNECLFVDFPFFPVYSWSIKTHYYSQLLCIVPKSQGFYSYIVRDMIGRHERYDQNGKSQRWTKTNVSSNITLRRWKCTTLGENGSAKIRLRRIFSLANRRMSHNGVQVSHTKLG